MIVLLILCLGCTRTLSNKSAQDTEEYAVYSALISSECIYESTVSIAVVDETYPVSQSEWLPKEISRVSDSLSQETTDDFLAKNKHIYQLENHFDLPAEYVLIELSEDMSGDLLSEHHVSMVLILSRVGFNDQANQALVNLFYFCGGECGRHAYYLLEKKDGIWEIQEELLLSIS